MLRKNNGIIISFLLLYVISAIISVVQTLQQKDFPGELIGHYRYISTTEVVTLSTINIISFLICYMIFISFQSFNLRVNKNIGIKFNDERMSSIIFIVLIAQVVFLIVTGVGKVTVNAGEVATSNYSALFAFLKPEPFFFLYFLYFRTKIDFKYKYYKLFTINIVLFILFKVLQGWTSFILLLFFLEMYTRFTKVKSAMALGLPIFIIFFGGWVYQYAFVLKNEIRGIETSSLTYYQGVEQLTSRLSMNSNSLAAYQNFDKVVELYKQEKLPLKESLSILRPIVPGGMIDKSYRILNNNIMASYVPDLNQFTSSDFGVVMYYSILYKASFPDFLLCLVLTLFFYFFAKIFFDSIAVYKGQYDILLFFIIFYSFYTVSLEGVFGQGFIPYLYTFVFLSMLGAIRFNKITKK